MDILFITPLNLPWADTLKWQNSKDDIIDKQYIKRKLDPKYPVGNLCMASYLKKNMKNINVNILDYNTVALHYIHKFSHCDVNKFYQYGIDLIKEKVGSKNYYPKLICISSLFSSNYCDLGSLLSYLKKVFPDSIITTGGHLSAACYKEFLEKWSMYLDAVCYGEGEIPVLKLVNSILNYDVKQYLEDDDSWITVSKLSRPSFIPKNTLIENLDEIPPYELEMCLFYEDYFNTNQDVFSLGSDNIAPNERDIAMFATRGCPYRCIFCASQFIHGHRVRKYSVKRLKDDMLLYNKKYGITSFPFLDDHFLHFKDHALELLNFIKENGFNSRIFNLAYIHVDKDIIKALKDTGSDRALITIDGLNEDFLRRVVRKPAHFKKAKEVINAFRDEKMVILNNVIIGFPGETPEMIEKGVKTMLDMGANWYQVLTAIPLHGSELYDICEKGGFIKSDCDLFNLDYHTSVIETKDFTSDWIKWKAYEINLRLNFVENYDMKHGEYEVPLSLYERIIDKVLDSHAFAYYYAALCAKYLGDINKYNTYREKYLYYSKDAFWENWINYFKLTDLREIEKIGVV